MTKLAKLILNPWFAVTLNLAMGTLFTAIGLTADYGWTQMINMWCGGIWFGYAIMGAMRPRITEKWKREMRAEMEKMGDETIKRINREMVASIWSPAITPPDEPHGRRLQ